MNNERPFSPQNSLKVNKESRKIIKNTPLPKPLKPTQLIRDGMIYSVPQRVINVSTQNFKDVVQSLTGIEQPTGLSEVSPAARLASTERTSSEKKERSSWSNGDDDMMRMLDNGVQMSPFPGILSPEPAILPSFHSENFLPATLPPITPLNLPQTPSDILTPNNWPPLPSDFFSQITWPLTPTDTFLQDTFPMIPSGSRTPETLQQKPIGVFSPVLGRHSQTVLSYNDVWPENNAFVKPSEFFPPEDGSPRSPPIQFKPFNY
ncbi:hypothetical protein RYX36_014211 [Vicia faba]